MWLSILNIRNLNLSRQAEIVPAKIVPAATLNLNSFFLIFEQTA